jgi:hypothetical protein
LCLGLHGDDPDSSKYLEFEVSIAGDGHELDITQPPQDDVVRPGEVNYLECERLGVVVAHVSEGDRQGDPPKRDGLFVWDHSIERVWAALELITGKPQPLKSVEVHEVEAAAPSMRALVSWVVSTSGLTMRGNLPSLGMLSGWSVKSKVIGDSDQRRYSRTAALTALIDRLVSLSLRCNSWKAGPP